MTNLRVVLTALATGVALLTPGDAGAQSWESCTVILGQGADTPPDCAVYGEPIVTLTGAAEVLPRLSDQAQVSCWLCPSGVCDETSAYGPASYGTWLGPSSRVETFSWEVRFHLSEQAWRAAGGLQPLSQYYCQLELRNTDDRSRYPGPMATPEYGHSYPHARAEQGTPLVVELQGALPQPIGETRE